jgi:hypothetical protein
MKSYWRGWINTPGLVTHFESTLLDVERTTVKLCKEGCTVFAIITSVEDVDCLIDMAHTLPDCNVVIKVFVPADYRYLCLIDSALPYVLEQMLRRFCETDFIIHVVRIPEAPDYEVPDL